MNSPAVPTGKLLTVMIPVFNGAHFLSNLLGQFVDQFSMNPALFERVEIRVINNASTDATLEVARSFTQRLPFLRINDEKIHVPTAEENVFRSFASCEGEYCWALGVDDFPTFQNFPRVLQALESRRHDFLLFNSSVIDHNLKFSSYSVTNLSSECVVRDLTEFACDLGIWFVLAGLSSQIVRTALVRNFDLMKLAKATSPIYSHVIAYLEIFRGRPAAMFNFPLVTYRVTFNDQNHWRKAAEKLNVFDTFFWSLGTIRQFKYLEQKGVIAKDFFSYLRDRNEFIVFRPVYVVLDNVVRQLEIMITDSSPRNRMSLQELDEIKDYISLRDPFCRQLLWQIAVEYQQIVSPAVKIDVKQGLIGRLRSLLQSYIDNGPYATFFTEHIHGFNVYRLPSLYCAVLPDCKGFFEKQMRDIYALRDSFPAFFVSTSREELYMKIKGVRDSLEAGSYQEFVDALPVRQELKQLTQPIAVAAPAAAAVVPPPQRSLIYRILRKLASLTLKVIRRLKKETVGLLGLRPRTS